MRRKNNESGMILPLVIILMFALTITGLAFLSSTVMEHNLAMREVYKTQAFYLAEGGIEHARVVLGEHWEDWEDYSPVIPNTELEGTYSAYISDEDTGGNELPEHKRRIKSIGTVKNVSQIVQVIVRQAPSGAEIKVALETKGEVRIRGTATIRGDLEHKAIIAEAIDPQGNYTIEPEDGISISPECTIETPYLGCFADFSPAYPYEDYFEYVFKMKKEEMKDLVKKAGDKYYANPVKNADVEGITWIDDPNQEGFEVTRTDWEGQGILIVNGDMKITGGSFNGILWVIGTLEVGAGNPIINGAVIVESDITETTPLEGKLEVNYGSEKIISAVGEIATLPWVEKGTWEQLK